MNGFFSGPESASVTWWIRGSATSDLAKEAALKAIAQAELTPHDIDFIVVGTTTPDMVFPSTACLLQTKIGADRAWGFDLGAACSGFTYALTTAVHMVRRARIRTPLPWARMSCRASSITPIAPPVCFFGDGAGAVVVSPATDGFGIIDFEHEIDGTGGPALCMPAGGSLRPASHDTVDQRLHYVKQDGQAVFKFAVRKTEEICARIMARNKIAPADIDLFVSHQANRRIIMSAAERLGLPPEKVVDQYREIGNTTAGTIPLALTDAVAQGRLKKGDLVLLASVGAGFTVGSVLLRWAI